MYISIVCSCVFSGRHLRAPPPEPEHLTFIRRFLSPGAQPSSETDTIIVPPPKQRVPWLWPQGMPTASNSKRKNEHASMRITTQIDPQEAEAERLRERLRVEEELRSSSAKRSGARDKSESRPPPVSRHGQTEREETQANQTQEHIASSNVTLKSNASEDTLRPPKKELEADAAASSATSGVPHSDGHDQHPQSDVTAQHERAEQEQDAGAHEEEEHDDEQDEDEDEEEDEEEEEEDGEEDADERLSRTIDALDLGL